MEKITRECENCNRTTILEECICGGKKQDTEYQKRVDGEDKKPEPLEVLFYSGYNNGVPKCEASIEGEKFVIEMSELIARLEKDILEKGYTVSKTNRQKFPRLHINS